MKQQSLTHHYIPTFYLKRWTAGDGRLCELSRPYDVVKPQRKTAEAAGHLRGLYTVPGLPAEKQSVLEDTFFRQTDQAASDALDFMVANTSGAADMPARLRSGWSRFLLSLVHRTPERVEQLRRKLRMELATRLPEIERDYQAQRQPSEPETFAELRKLLERDVEEKTWAVLLERVIDSVTVGGFLNAMHWSIVTFSAAPHALITSDRPVCMTNGIDRPDGHVALPVGPTQVFLAAKTPEIEVALRQENAKALHARLNDIVARQAIRYVYSTDDRQLRFVENRLRRNT